MNTDEHPVPLSWTGPDLAHSDEFVQLLIIVRGLPAALWDQLDL
jgi:hypothetical protein